MTKCKFCKNQLPKIIKKSPHKRIFCSQNCGTRYRYHMKTFGYLKEKVDERYARDYKPKKKVKIPCLKCGCIFKSDNKIKNRICKPCAISNSGCLSVIEVNIMGNRSVR